MSYLTGSQGPWKVPLCTKPPQRLTSTVFEPDLFEFVGLCVYFCTQPEDISLLFLSLTGVLLSLVLRQRIGEGRPTKVRQGYFNRLWDGGPPRSEGRKSEGRKEGRVQSRYPCCLWTRSTFHGLLRLTGSNSVH